MFFKYGNTSLSNSHFNSNGTPGSAKIVPRESSTMNAGAVPLGLCTGMAPVGILACRWLFFVITIPLFWNLFSNWLKRSFDVTNFLPVTSAIASLVRAITQNQLKLFQRWA